MTVVMRWSSLIYFSHEEFFQLVGNLTSNAYAFATYQRINDSFTVNDAQYYGADFYNPPDHGTSHTSVIGPNGDAVAVTSTVNLS